MMVVLQFSCNFDAVVGGFRDCIYLYHHLFFFPERGEGGEKKRERNINERNMTGCFFYAPGLGMEPTT